MALCSNGMFLCVCSRLLRRPLPSPILSTDTHNVLNAMIPIGLLSKKNVTAKKVSTTDMHTAG